MFDIQEVGPIREPILGLYIGDGTNSRYCAWFSSFKEHAIDYALLHNQDLKLIKFSGLTGNVKFTTYEVQDPVTIDEFVPSVNRTQIGIAKQMHDSFWVRFIIDYDNNNSRHTFLVEYPGVAPDDLLHKVFWGFLREAGDTPASVPFLFN